MRILIPLLPLLILTACKEREVTESVPTLKIGHYLQQTGRGRLCVLPGDGPQQAAFIAFGSSGDANCSASGTVRSDGGAYSLQPKGEGDCRIPLSIDGDRITVGSIPEACSYYCAPNVVPDLQPFAFTSDTLEVISEPLSPVAAC